MEKIAYRVDEAVEASGLGRTTLYEAIAAGELETLKVGARRLIPRDALLAFLGRHRAADEAREERDEQDVSVGGEWPRAVELDPVEQAGGLE